MKATYTSHSHCQKKIHKEYYCYTSRTKLFLGFKKYKSESDPIYYCIAVIQYYSACIAVECHAVMCQTLHIY